MAFVGCGKYNLAYNDVEDIHRVSHSLCFNRFHVLENSKVYSPINVICHSKEVFILYECTQGVRIELYAVSFSRVY